ncbi:Disease resistance protein (TIR-NBS-LRR class) family [Euphorbia peplus]|nr:Disease resistance protein (TIR-NBS-LRR class) family [Euphorbia peplus]
MGRDIVRQESPGEPGKRSRLWHYRDIHHVLTKDTGTEQVEGIVLSSYGKEDGVLSGKAFAKMKRLRLLKLQNLQVSKELGYLSNNLRYLEWDKYPFKSFPSSFQPNHLVELNMQSSNMVQLWKGIKPLRMLKVIDLSYSVNLIKTMDFKEVPNLEKLNLEGCSKLIEVHQSIGILRDLFSLNLRDCKNLSSLPNSICDLKSLKFLYLYGCSNLEKLPDRLGEMTCLEKLSVGEVATRQLPLARVWDMLIPSRFLPWKNPNPMAAMLPSLLILRSLKSLDLSYCNLTDVALPNDMGCFPLLKTLNLSGNNFVSIPSSISRLPKLEDFRFAECRRLESFPNLPSSILYLSMEGCSALEALLPRSISKEFRLEGLNNERCRRLQLIPDLSSTILNLSVEGLGAEESDHASKQTKLTFINNLTLFEVESGNTNVFARLSSYLHYLLRHGSQGLFNPSSKISMCLSGDEIPGWFNYQSPGSSLEVHLPPHWWTNKWMGFFLCVVYELAEPASETWTISCTLSASIGPDQDLFLGHSAIDIPKDSNLTSNEIPRGTNLTPDQLWFKYMPRSSLTCLDMWNECKGLKVKFASDRLVVKNCGLRVMFSRDVDELVLCSRAFQNLVSPRRGGKRIRDECCYDSTVEANEGGELGLPAKRLKLNLKLRRPLKR